MAVAVTYGAETFYTDDDGQASFAKMCGLNVRHTWDLTISDRYAQRKLEEVSEPWPIQRKPKSS